MTNRSICLHLGTGYELLLAQTYIAISKGVRTAASHVKHAGWLWVNLNTIEFTPVTSATPTSDVFHVGNP